MRHLCRWLILLLLAAPAALTPALAQTAPGKRIALVIGNGDYRTVERLANPVNDARLVAETLQALGFTLVGGGAQTNLDKPQLDQAVQAFGRALPGAEVALFYYSGHGLQVQGVNWLVPVNADPTRPQDLDFQMVDADIVLRQMDGAGTKLNILILDACRNNPFAIRGLRAMGSGLAEMRAPEGTLISYATQPGNVAQDGTGANSPYTAALTHAMQQPGQDIFRTFNQVGLQVKRVTGGAQQPWVSSSPIDGDFSFASAAAPAPVVESGAQPSGSAGLASQPQMAGLARPLALPLPTPPRPEEAVQALTRALPCSVLEAQVADGRIRVTGLAPPGREFDAFLDRVNATGRQTPSLQVERLPAFACRPVEAVAELARRNRASAQPLLLRLEQRVVTAGQRFTAALGRADTAVSYVDLYAPDGTVRHVVSGSRAPDMVGGPAPGRDGARLLVAIIAPELLPLGPRPAVERADVYLAALRPALQTAQARQGAELIRAEVALFSVRRAATPATAPRAVAPAPDSRPARCGDLVQRFQLGEPLSPTDRATLSARCGL